MEEILMCWLKLSSSRPLARMRVLLANHLIVIGDCYLDDADTEGGTPPVWRYSQSDELVGHEPTHYMLMPPVPRQVNT
jgi:hypothetical protein